MSRRADAKPLVVREYLRVSRDTTGVGASLDQQHDETESAIGDEGWTLHPEPYRDRDRSASSYATKGREGFAALIADLENDSFDADVLAIWESSRGSRRVGEWVDLIDLCRERGVKLWVTTHRRLYDPENARDRRTILEDAVDAAYESDKSRERIRRNVRAAAEQGRVHGKNLYGYRRIYTQTPSGPKVDRVELEPQQAAVVVEAVQRVLDGDTYHSIAKDLNARGEPPRRPATKKNRRQLGWTGSAVKEMVSNPAYAGKRVHHGEIVADAVWPRIIDEESWQKIRAKMAQSPKRNPNEWTVRHLLTGIAVCDVCGAGMRLGKQNRGRGVHDEEGRLVCTCKVTGMNDCPSHYASYLCGGAPGKTSFHTAMRMDFLDQIVTELVLARIERPDFLALLGEKDGGTADERRALIAEISTKRAYLDSVREEAARQMRMDILFDQERRVQPEIDALQRRLERLADVDPKVLDLAQRDNVRDVWENELDVVAKRRIVTALLTPRIKRVAPEQRGHKGPNPDRVIPDWH